MTSTIVSIIIGLITWHFTAKPNGRKWYYYLLSAVLAGIAGWGIGYSIG